MSPIFIDQIVVKLGVLRSDGQTNHSEDPSFGPNNPNSLSTSDGKTITFFVVELLAQ
jgi:hypothetical protein